MKTPIFRIAKTRDDFEKVLSLRAIIFVEELQTPYSKERDDYDFSAIHILGEQSGEPFACSRIRVIKGQAQIDRLAVRKSYRRRGLGKQLLQFTLEAVEQTGLSTCSAAVPQPILPLFSALGFQDSGETIQETGTLHLLTFRFATGKESAVQAVAKDSPKAASPKSKTAAPKQIKRSSTPGSKKPSGPGKRSCAVSGTEFLVTEDDLAFYAKIGVPAPTLCPDERSRRRMSFANQRNLFHRTCDGSGIKILSPYTPGGDYVVYDIEYWFSDNWDQYASGRDYDFKRPFFEQFHDLARVAPRPSAQRDFMSDENSDYTNYAGKNKNCFLIFDSDKNRDCYYSYSINSCEDVMDCFRVESSELCYKCVDCTNCYGSSFLQNCDNCADSYFLKNCIGCQDCIGCVNLKNKRNYFLNKPCSKEEYQEKLKKLGLVRYSRLSQLRLQFAEFTKQFPERATQGVQNENVIGDYLTYCKNALYCFDSRKLWDCKHITQAFDDAKDCMDCTEVGDGAELMYESCYAGYNGQNIRFTTHCLGQVSDLTYCYHTPYSKNCFGCIGLRRAEYCILNKQYSKQEYFTTVEKIIKQMTASGEWGEFFPPEISPFPYNKTHAYEYFPLNKEEALARGYSWQDDEARDFQPSSIELPDSINEVSDSILGELLSCESTQRNFRIQKAELAFYQKARIPIPRHCPDERHMRRVRMRNPRVLHERRCAVSGKEILTTVSPGKTENVVCEEEFAKLLE